MTRGRGRRREARRSRAVLVLEPCLPDGSVKTFRKGVGVFELHVEGRPAHAGLDHANHGIERIDKLPLGRNQTSRINDGSCEEPYLAQEGKRKLYIAVPGIQGRKEEPNAQR